MIWETYSQRIKKEVEGLKDVYTYDNIPDKLRVQIMHIWTEVIAEDEEVWENIHNILAKELGMINLGGKKYSSERDRCIYFLLNHTVSEEVIDIIELAAYFIDEVIFRYDPNGNHDDRKQRPKDAISEINHRFKENGLGYEYINGTIVRIDKMFIHEEIVKPAINLISDLQFEGANDEFMEAHECFRQGDYKGAIHNAQKSFESTMKTICNRMDYQYGAGDTAKNLIQLLFNQEFIPKYLNTHFNALRSTLQAGLPTVRNKKAGHGQGEEIDEVPEYLASYCINLLATNILLLIDIYQSKKV